MPLVLIRTWKSGPTTFASISSNAPIARVVLVTPDGGVAWATPTPAMAITATAASEVRNKRLERIGSP